jgi:hypothetical protein
MAAAIAVGKRCQERGQKRGRRRGCGGGGGSSGGSGGGVAAAAGAAVAGAVVVAVAAIASGERPEVRVEIGVPRTLVGDYLAQIRAMFLGNRFHVYKLATIWCTSK